MNTLLETLSSWLLQLGFDPLYGDRLARLLVRVGLMLVCAFALCCSFATPIVKVRKTILSRI